MRATLDNITYEVDYEIVHDEIDYEPVSFIHIESVKLKGFDVIDTLEPDDIIRLQELAINHVSEL